jgi:hypothetical protein
MVISQAPDLDCVFGVCTGCEISLALEFAASVRAESWFVLFPNLPLCNHFNGSCMIEMPVCPEFKRIEVIGSGSEW